MIGENDYIGGALLFFVCMFTPYLGKCSNDFTAAYCCRRSDKKPTTNPMKKIKNIGAVIEAQPGWPRVIVGDEIPTQ